MDHIVVVFNLLLLHYNVFASVLRLDTIEVSLLGTASRHISALSAGKVLLAAMGVFDVKFVHVCGAHVLGFIHIVLLVDSLSNFTHLDVDQLFKVNDLRLALMDGSISPVLWSKDLNYWSNLLLFVLLSILMGTSFVLRLLRFLSLLLTLLLVGNLS